MTWAVRKFILNEQEFFVDLVLGTILTEIDESADSEEVMLSFKPNPEIVARYESSEEDIHYVEIEISSDVAGDFLCE